MKACNCPETGLNRPQKIGNTAAGRAECPPAFSSPPNNPFASSRVRPGAIPFQFPSGSDAAQLVARFAKLGWRGAIVGPHGTGKSTLLAALTPELARAGREIRAITLHNGQRRWPREIFASLRIGGTGVLIVDGYEQLSYWSRWRLHQRCRAVGAGLLVTSHAPTRLSLLFRTQTDADMAERIVRQLLAADADRVPPIANDDIRRAWSAHQGNLRETLFDLYDAFERQRR